MTLHSSLRLQRHVYELAAAFDVRVLELVEAAPETAAASPQLRAIRIGLIHDETTYAVALHELGHLCSPTGDLSSQRGDRYALSLTEEEAAWAWARHYALDWTESMEAVKTWALSTYLAAAPVAPKPPKKVDWSKD
jgi:antitoxin component HigA of HigAB toxin-antitoxin module